MKALGLVTAVIAFIAVAGVISLLIASTWRLFTKAGKPGWATCVPVYNLMVMLSIAGQPVWWVVFLFIPLVNFIMLALMLIAVAEAFGKGPGFGLGLAFLVPVFLP